MLGWMKTGESWQDKVDQSIRAKGSKPEEPLQDHLFKLLSIPLWPPLEIRMTFLSRSKEVTIHVRVL